MRRLSFIEGRPPVIQTEKMDPTIGTNFKEVWSMRYRIRELKGSVIIKARDVT
jgi:hypothetical protein